MLSSSLLPQLLAAVGDVLREREATVDLFVVGGAAMLLRGDATRLMTMDVDVLARVEGGSLLLPIPFPPDLQHAIDLVADGYGLDPDWMNAVVASNWRERWPQGLPADLLGDAERRTFGGLTVTVAGSSALVPLKLHAVVDRARAVSFDLDGRVLEVDLSPPDARRHLDDLVSLAPNDDELDGAASWVRTQDTSPDISPFLTAAIRHVRSHRH
jgi:hypothetical protein